MAKAEEQKVDEVSRDPLEHDDVEQIPQTVLRHRALGEPDAQQERQLECHVFSDFEEVSVSDAARRMLRDVEDRNFFRPEKQTEAGSKLTSKVTSARGGLGC